jgi:hypothetical protein
MMTEHYDHLMIVHNLAQMSAALSVATELDRHVVLQNPPASLAYAGLAYLRSMQEQALRQHPTASYLFICDVGDQVGEVETAFQAGFSVVRCVGSDAMRESLEAIANHYQGTLLWKESIDPEMDVLDLGFVEDPVDACRRWLLAETIAA